MTTTIQHPPVACARCHGEGSVPDNPSRRNDPQCEIDVQCPVCHGDGARRMAAWERAQAFRLGAYPGQYVIVDSERHGEYRAEEIEFITDNDGWRDEEFVFDAETGYHARPDEILAVVRPYCDPYAALAQFVGAVLS